MLRDEISKLRQSYSHATLDEHQAHANPIEQFEQWFQEAARAEIVEHNAMTLATCVNNMPDARIVLLKSFSNQGFVFFTNYNSAKGRELDINPRAALVFLWKDLERQVRIRGEVQKVPKAVSEEYFNTRPIDSQCGAVASQQSQPIASRDELDAQYAAVLDAHKENGPQMPAHWGGYLLVPNEIEFWQGREGRMHDRLLYRHQNAKWDITRLQP